MKLSVKLTPTRITLAILAIITGVYHLLLPDLMLMLNGLGFLGLLAAYFVRLDFIPIKRPTLRWLFMGYTLITIVLYFALRGLGGLTFIEGMVIKLVELGLLFLLYQDR
jgi:hypothetical protein